MSTVAVARAPVVAIAGEPVAGLAGALLAVRIEQRFDCPALAELTCDGRAPLATAIVGRQLTVIAPEIAAPLFEGTVTAIERVYPAGASLEIRVRAEDGLHRLRHTLTLTSYASAGFATVAGELAARHGLEVDAPPRPDPVAEPTPLVPHHRSDLDLLVSVARRHGRHVVADGNRIRLVDPDGAGEPVALAWPTELLEVSIDAQTRRAGAGVTTYGWDAHAARGWKADAAPCAVAALEPPAAQVLAATAAGRQRVLLGGRYGDEASLRRAAQSAAAGQKRSVVVLRGTAIGEPRLRPGTPIAVAGVDPEACGRYVLTVARHRWDSAAGYLTEISTEPPPIEESAVPSLGVGRVVRVDDPAGAGRVRVALPGHGGLESGWLPVIAAGAGPGKGLVALPAIDDRVLVALPDADPAGAVVLGGLWGAQGPPAVDGEQARADRLTFTSPAGHAVTLDDRTGRVVLQHASGARVELAAGRVLVHAESDLVLEAPGHTMTLRAAAIDFEQA